MAENNIEKRVGDVEARQAVQDAKFDAFMQSLNDFKQEMRDFKTEMRDRDNQRAAEIIELRQKHDADIKEMRQELDRKVDRLSNDIKEVSNEVKSIGREVRGLFIAFIAVIVAIMIGMFWNQSTNAKSEAVAKTPTQASIERNTDQPIETAGR